MSGMAARGNGFLPEACRNDGMRKIPATRNKSGEKRVK
jgi:hypothetical protein